MTALDLHGRAALVTGGGTRVGAAIVRALAAAGCDVLIHYAKSEAGARAVAADVERLGRRAVLLQADLTDRAAIQPPGSVSLRGVGAGHCAGPNRANFERTPPEELSA